MIEEEKEVKELQKVTEVEEVKKSEEAKAEVQEDEKKGFSIASMVLGICSIVFCIKFAIGGTCRNSCYNFWSNR